MAMLSQTSHTMYHTSHISQDTVTVMVTQSCGYDKRI